MAPLMNQRCIVVLALLTLNGCTTTPPPSPSPSPDSTRGFSRLEPVGARVALPALNSETISQVGDTMVGVTGNLYRYDAILLLQPILHRGTQTVARKDASGLRHGSSTKLPYVIKIPEGEFIASGTSGEGSERGTFFKAQLSPEFGGTKWEAVEGGVFVRDTDGDAASEIYWHTAENLVRVEKVPVIRFERIAQHEEWRSDTFRQELLYNGRSGTTIKLLYREFLEERIRPAFTQEATYDLEQDNTIGFKGTRFQVLDADNIRIKFVVLHHFD